MCITMEKDKFLSEYFARLNLQYGKIFIPSMENLIKLQAQHLINIPFENTYVQSGKNISLDIEKLFTKVVVQHRGGFCFELNGLFNVLLKVLGYNTILAGGEVLSNADTMVKNEHALSIVQVDGTSYTVDVSFGSMGPSDPLPLVFDTPLEAGNGVYQFKTLPNCEILLEVKQKLILDLKSGEEIKSPVSVGEWRPLYKFRLSPLKLGDFAQPLFYHTTNPASVFMKEYFMCKHKHKGKVTLKGNILTFYTLEGNMTELSEQKIINEDEIGLTIEEHFGLKENVL